MNASENLVHTQPIKRGESTSGCLPHIGVEQGAYLDSCDQPVVEVFCCQRGKVDREDVCFYWIKTQPEIQKKKHIEFLCGACELRMEVSLNTSCERTTYAP